MSSYQNDKRNSFWKLNSTNTCSKDIWKNRFVGNKGIVICQILTAVLRLIIGIGIRNHLLINRFKFIFWLSPILIHWRFYKNVSFLWLNTTWIHIWMLFVNISVLKTMSIIIFHFIFISTVLHFQNYFCILTNFIFFKVILIVNNWHKSVINIIF